MPAEQLGEEFKAIGFYLSGHPLDDYSSALRRSGVITLDQLLEKVKNGPLVAKLSGIVSGKQERKSARGNRFAFIQLSDTTGNYEATLFSDTLEACRDFLEVGSKVVISVEATMESEQLKLLCRSAQPMDGAVAKFGAAGLRVYLESIETISSVATVLDEATKVVKNAKKGPVSFCLMDDSLPGEVDIELGQKFSVTPQIKGALKSLQGVLMVEDI